MSGKNFSLVCTDGVIKVHFLILRLKTELVFNAEKYDDTKSLKVDFPKEVVEKCILAFYDEYDEEYDPAMFDVFIFFMARPEYLDFSRYDMSMEKTDQFSLLREEYYMKYLYKNSIILGNSNKISHKKYVKLYEQKLLEMESLCESDDDFADIYGLIEELTEIVKSRLSTIIERYTNEKSYNRKVQECMNDIIRLVTLHNTRSIVTRHLFNGLEMYGIYNQINCRLMREKFDNFSDYFKHIGLQEIEIQNGSVLSDITVIAMLKLPEEKSIKLFGRHNHNIMIKIGAGGADYVKIMRLAQEYSWITFTILKSQSLILQ